MGCVRAFCYIFDPKTSKYEDRLVRLSGIVNVYGKQAEFRPNGSNRRIRVASEPGVTSNSGKVLWMENSVAVKELEDLDIKAKKIMEASINNDAVDLMNKAERKMMLADDLRMIKVIKYL